MPSRAATVRPWRLWRHPRKCASLSPATLHLLGYALSDVGAADHAVSLLRRAQRQYPGDLWLNDALGWLCYSTPQPPQYDESVRFYTAARAIRPRNPHMAYSIGRALRDKGSFAEAIAEFTKAIELKPDHRDAWWDRAYCYSELGQPESALADCSKVIESNPTLALAWSSRSWAYANLGQNDKALADSSRAIELDPKLAHAWNNRSWAYETWGNMTRRLPIPPRPSSWIPSSRSRGTTGAGPMKTWGNMTRRLPIPPRPSSWTPAGGLVALPQLVYLHLGQYDKAIADYAKASELDPKNANAHNERGLALATDPNPTRVTRAARSIVPRKPSSSRQTTVTSGTPWVWLTTAPAIGKRRLGRWKNR